ncbi:DUF896 domain-containing protein [Anaerobium acetethylicum]|uniref:UPF0291 protein SAMN05421730_1001273 n=1 Tax=Anaerobium acetethylicum TaxID=1619234 RepID=A0A1D3TNW6_9FIRM|nr:DUF896 domain-containing protein [Anaerobium acetethylicum]SCP95052.1 Uncharacterized protein YnzC, UPF0291/DUF896 family [Anaerobium acetethylicum]
MNESKITRINELYRKAKAEGLTAEETKEQADLRREYVESVKCSLRGQLNNVSIQNPDGTIVDLGKKHAGKTGN